MPHKNREDYLQYHRDYSKRKYEHKKNYKMRKDLLKKYNLTPSDYEELLVAQDFKCAICKKHISEFKRRLAVDHCHETGRVRGLLCMPCNIGLGHLGDTEESLLNALSYLRTANQGP